MGKVAILDSIEHRNVRVGRPAAAPEDNQRFVQVILREFPLLAAQYPILLSKDSETGAFFCGAMLGFDEGENLFLEEGRNHQGYRPLNLQRIPFYYVENDRLALDFDSPRVGAPDGEPLFQADGQPSPYLQSILAIFHELRPGIQQTKNFIGSLLKYNLLTPVQFELSFDNGDQITLKDLYTIRESALGGLPDEIVLEFFRNGYLYAAHLMLASLNQIANLARRKNEFIVAGACDLPDAHGFGP